MPTSPANAIDAHRPRRLIPLVGLLAILGPLTIDLYLPAFPQLQADLMTSASGVQLTLSAATVGFALGQLVVGPWSDTLGRRRPLLLATAIHVLASIGIALSQGIEWVLVLRVLQGAGVLATAMIRDTSEGSALLRGLARVALFTGLAPVFAPFLGAQLMTLLDWRGLFLVVAGYGLLMILLGTLFIPEPLPAARRRPNAGVTGLLAGASRLVRDRRFVGVALIGGLMVSSVFAYLSTSSFVLQDQYGLNPQGYGAISAVNAVAFVIGTQGSALVARRVLPGRILGVVLPTLASTGILLALLPRLGGGLWAVVITMAVFMAFAGACSPCLGVLGLADHRDNAGTAAALLGAANFGMAGLAAPVVGAFDISTFMPLGIVMACLMGTATVLLHVLVRPRRASGQSRGW